MSALRSATTPVVAFLFACLFALSGCVRSGEPQADPALQLRLETLAQSTGVLFASLEGRPAEDRGSRYAELAAQTKTLRGLARQRLTDPGLENALVLHLTDYDRQIDALAQDDAETPGAAPHPALIALRRAAISDALSDALFYEKSVLNRSR